MSDRTMFDPIVEAVFDDPSPLLRLVASLVIAAICIAALVTLGVAGWILAGKVSA